MHHWDFTQKCNAEFHHDVKLSRICGKNPIIGASCASEEDKYKFFLLLFFLRTVFVSARALLAGVLDCEAVVVSREDSVAAGHHCREIKTTAENLRVGITLLNVAIVSHSPSKGSTLYVRRLASSALGTKTTGSRHDCCSKIGPT